MRWSQADKRNLSRKVGQSQVDVERRKIADGEMFNQKLRCFFFFGGGEVVEKEPTIIYVIIYVNIYIYLFIYLCVCVL